MVSALLLRQWYAKYHPDGGPLRFESAEDLERGLGERLRAVYDGSFFLQTLLARSILQCRVTDHYAKEYCHGAYYRYKHRALSLSLV